jgi:hypothetical protein
VQTLAGGFGDSLENTMPLNVQSAAMWKSSISELNERCGWDCTMSAFDGWRLQLSSGTSEETQHPLASFSGVSYLSCPMVLSHPTFRLANAAEQAQVGTIVALDGDDKVLAIDAETMAGMASHVFFIVAQTCEVAPR